MKTTHEYIKNLVDANAKHIAEITTESEAKCWLNSLLWSVAGFKQTINEEELDRFALEHFNKQWSTNYKSIKEIKDELDLEAIDDFKAGYRKALEE